MQLDVIWPCLMGMYSFILGTELSLNWYSTVEKEYWQLEKREAEKVFTLNLKHKPCLKVRVLRLIKWHVQRLKRWTTRELRKWTPAAVHHVVKERAHSAWKKSKNKNHSIQFAAGLQAMGSVQFVYYPCAYKILSYQIIDNQLWWGWGRREVRVLVLVVKYLRNARLKRFPSHHTQCRIS